jgi:hypothetical protein
MRFVVAIVLLIGLVVGVGFYRGWFHVSSASPAKESSVTVTVDKDKIQQDKNDAQKKVQDLKQK